jgi:methylmalonyl-CoA mutase
MKGTSTLLSKFPASTKEEWRAVAEKLLKGKPFDKVMMHDTPEGIQLESILQKDVLDELPATKTLPGFDDYLRGTHAAGYNAKLWEIAQELPYGLPSEFNRAAREDLMRGQNALNISLDVATLKGIDPDQAAPGEVGACGLSLACLEDIETAFSEIIPEAISFHMYCGCSGLSIAALFFAWLTKKGIEAETMRGSFNMDPLATLAANGTLPSKLENLLDEQFELANYCSQNAAEIKSIGVSTMPYHQAGASSVQELGIALATGVHYIRAMTERGMSVDDAAKQIRFSLAIGPNFFMEMAKIRSVRVLWAKVVASFGGSGDAQKIQLHARTGLHNKTRKDPYVNMLRTSMEALSGVIAGIDSLCVGHFDETARLPDSFGRRISRNTHLILQEECELTNVVDPAGGSWTIEWLTNEVSEKSWLFFQEIEAAGGIESALKQGLIQEKVAATAADRKDQFHHRRVSLIGTNVYPNVDEAPLKSNKPNYNQLREIRIREVTAARSALHRDAEVRRIQILEKITEPGNGSLLPALTEAVLNGATIQEITKASRNFNDPEKQINPLSSARLAADYEALRDAADDVKSETGSHPRIFLVNLGLLGQHKARADFAKSFFAAGGFDVISPAGFEKPDNAVAALKESGAAIAIVCGTDDEYAESFTDYATAIKAALPNTHLVLAGFPGDKETDYRAAGMDDFISIKSNNFAVNQDYLKRIGAL